MGQTSALYTHHLRTGFPINIEKGVMTASFFREGNRVILA